MNQRISEIAGTIFGLLAEDLNEESSTATIENWDSLRHMKLILALEEEFAVRLTAEEIIEFDSIIKINRGIKSHLKKANKVVQNY